METRLQNKYLRNIQGFTLIELIFVIAILGILMMIAIPVFGNTTENARIKADEVNLRTAQNALLLYIAESEDYDLSNLTNGIQDLIEGVTVEGVQYGPYLPVDFSTQPLSKEYKDKGYVMLIDGTDVIWGIAQQ